MALFSGRQVRLFKALCCQHANMLRVEDPGVSEFEIPKWTLKPTFLHLFMFNFLDPEFSAQNATSIIYHYDSSCSGSLDFDDFLEFLQDYEEELTSKVIHQPSSPNPYNYAGGDISQWSLTAAAAMEDTYLAELTLKDPQVYWQQRDPITERLMDAGDIMDASVLTRRIVVHLLSLKNALCFSSLKQYEKGIQFNSLNPFVRVICCGQVKNSRCLLDEVEPEWHQSLSFNIVFPPGQTEELQQWVNRQFVEFVLMDSRCYGMSKSYSEVLGYACVPLSMVLLSARKPVSLSLVLSEPTGCFQPAEEPRLEVTLIDEVNDFVEWVKISDAMSSTDEIFYQKFTPKYQQDLTSCLIPYRSKTLEKEMKDKKKPTLAGDNTNTFWGYLRRLYTFLTSTFPRRAYQIIGLNEADQFRPLMSMVRPIQNSHSQKLSDIAYTISNMKLKSHPPLVAGKQKLVNDHFQIGPSMYSALFDQAFVDNPYAPNRSPSTLLSAPDVQPLEHAMLLCSLFLGVGAKAFVAIGSVKMARKVWVLVIEKCTDKPPIDLNRYVSLGDSMNFQYFPEFKKIVEFNHGYKITHWDPPTGSSFSNIEEKGFPFERIHTLFNHENMLFNVQRSDNLRRIQFSWDLSNESYWLPLLTEKAKELFGQVPCYYSEPFRFLDISLTPSPEDDAGFVTELVQMIQFYRRNFLLISDTPFSRSISQFLQKEVASLEELNRTYYRERGMKMTKDRVGKTISQCIQMVPDGHGYWGNAFYFKGLSSPNDVIELLAKTGFLDCAVPLAVYSIGATIVHQGFGIKSSWVFIGYYARLYS